MVSQHSRRFLRPFLYTVTAVAGGGGLLYYTTRPRNIPGLDPAAVPPPTYHGGRFQPPQFPATKPRDEQILELKRSSKENFTKALRDASDAESANAGKDEEHEYDLLVIGGGATGAGIALDAATRGLRVAMVERDDFSAGTSSKSTKLVHGGVRYLEKAVWELDYNQYVSKHPLLWS